ncbi:MAG: DUF2145 domain-containing protein [Pseudomonadota bacterium]
MIRFAPLLLVLALGGGGLMALPAGANSNQPRSVEPHAQPGTNTAQLVAFAKEVERVAGSRGARLFFLARVGRPPDGLPSGIEYTHVGIAVYSELSHGEYGYVLHNLYQSRGSPTRSGLVSDFPAEFFAGAAALKAGILIPTPAVQRRVLATVLSPRYRALHNPHYSAISNPFDVRYQNCTEFVLDVLHASLFDVADRHRLKTIASQRFAAQPIHVNAVQSFWASLVMPDVRFDDHPSGALTTATYGRLRAYLQDNDWLEEEWVIRP